MRVCATGISSSIQRAVLIRPIYGDPPPEPLAVEPEGPILQMDMSCIRLAKRRVSPIA